MPKVYLSPSDQKANTYSYGGTTEAIVCGKIAEECRKALVHNGVEVMVGQYDTMANRCKASDKFGADIHVPIHTNAFNEKVSGTRIFCYDLKGKGYEYAKKIFDVLAPVTPGTSENIKVNRIFEVRTPKAPTVYIEVDFHDVPTVAKWLIANTTVIGEAIAEGICDALGVEYKDKEPVVETPREVLYRVQVGAFSVKENADAYLKKVQAAGFPDAFIVEKAL